ncbi:hypothetical protein [Archangium lansingense]|uniref:Lipoprotein n=1 Tax=Archangium lansingense TaxID=2995310 RepID=A0ABT4A4S8_9BACT|nr:hypothetical protein [Archangium lansinium]MCY1076649.1 hypothetical protein [Archangium lansinium]
MALGNSTPVISVDLPYDNFNVELRGDDIVSREMQLHRSDTELRGSALGGTVKLELKPDKATGVIGGRPVNLKLRKQGDTLFAEGGFFDGPVTLRFSPKNLHVYVNQCTYDLKATENEGWYEGPRSCTSKLLPPVRVFVPPELLARGSAEQAALLLFTLGSGR